MFALFKKNSGSGEKNNLIESYYDCQFYWWRKPEYLEKTTDLSQVAEKTIT
jgi:hypothetical protein